LAIDETVIEAPVRLWSARPLLEVRDIIAGVQVSAPFGNVKYALQVFEVLDEFKPSAAAAEPPAAAGS